MEKQRGQKKPEIGTMDKMMEMLQKMEVSLGEIRQELKDIKEDFKRDLADQKKELTETKCRADDNTKRIEELERRAKGTQGGQKNLENVVLNLQLEKSLLFLRFQNIDEQEGEVIKDKMSKILAEFLQKEVERVRWDIDQAYRVNSQYAKTHNVPREIHVKFVKIETREEILRAQRVGPLTHEGKEIRILKQIPKKIRETRKKYFFLSNKLYLKGVVFRWLLPEGLLVIWEGSRIKIDTIAQAEAFFKKHDSELEGPGTGMEEGELRQDQTEEGAAAGPALGAEGGREPGRPGLRPRK